MCGIYGKVGFGHEVDANDCVRRTKMLRHRGPDNYGSFATGELFLGHTRLSILDLTPAGNQPFGDASARLVFNGEIYNWRDLSSRYLSGHQLSSHSDTEVLFLLLRAIGNRCLRLLDGMFSFAYYDTAARTLLLARDMTGIKPLHYIPGATHFEFSSEIKNLDYEPDPDRLKEYLLFGRIGENVLPYRNVRELLPGCFVTVDCVTGRWSETAYGEVESLVAAGKRASDGGLGEAAERLDGLLQRSVAMHEQSDAPIGFLCSGGLDSSLIAAIAGRSHPSIALYHADFEGEGRELHFAEQVAGHVGVPLHTTRITKETFWQTFAEHTYAQDLPIQHPHSLSLSLIAGRVQADGVKVLLSGEGADELFDGYYFYPSYARLMDLEKRKRSPRGALARLFRGAWRRMLEDPDPYWFFGEINPRFRKHAHVGIGDAWSLSEPVQALALVGGDFRAWARWQQALEAFDWMADRREASVQSFQLFYMRYHLQPLLHRLDRMLMLHSVEGRVPYLETDVIDFAVNLPLQWKCSRGEGKRVLKEVARRYLPAEIVDRKKLGFVVPWSSYSTQFPRCLADGFVAEWTGLSERHLREWVGDDTVQLYRLISIEIWGRIFVRKERWENVVVGL